ncbi:MAG: hypothetical protein LC687_04845 [Actinobacteria bacterium]|nr:hypothetical protein [Actinomycetota bacterium]MCA1807161.1 hypothetical protein [Actinomycetota bacterium]
METYRFIRFVKEPVNRRGRLEDVIKVFFDIDDYPQNYFEDEADFLEFLKEAGFIVYGSKLWVEIKTKLRVYGIHYVLDTKKNQLVHFGLEAAPTPEPSMRAIMREQLHTSGALKGPRGRRESNGDLHDYLKPVLQTIERIGRK